MTQAPVHFHKVKSHSGILGNDGADALAFQAAMMPDEADSSLNQAEKPFSPLYWLATLSREMTALPKLLHFLPRLARVLPPRCR